jgi:hypothetical protein
MKKTPSTKSARNLHILSQMALAGDAGEAVKDVVAMDHQRRDEFRRLAHDHHVVIRAFRTLNGAAVQNKETELSYWAAKVLEAEEARIANALEFLAEICHGLEAAGCPVVVMKSLDHWPDIGNDLDLYTSADEPSTRQVLQEELRGRSQPRAWGDRLAGKWNYRIPGLNTTIEIHHQRLGQTGEHRALARRFINRRVPLQILSYSFLVPAPEEQVIAATLQRMYRHLYVRICDVANTAGLVESGELNYAELRASADLGGIWPGVASYLKIVSDYLQQYRGTGLDLPKSIVRDAQLNGDNLVVRGPWLRLPIFPKIAVFYGKQMASMALRGDLPGTMRLSLLPPLASAAKVAYKLTGDHRGIW